MRQRIVWGIIGVLMVGVVGSALWGWHAVRQLSLWRPALTAREIATRVLAEHLAHQYPNAKVLVFGNPFTLRSGQSPEIYAFEKAEEKGLQEGVGPHAVVKVLYPALRPAFQQRPESVYVDPKTTTPLSFLVSENAFDRLIEGNPGFDVAVSLIGLPVNLRQCSFWNQETPHLGLLLPDWRPIGGSSDLRTAMQSGKIVAAVVPRPGTSGSDQTVTGTDYHQEFDRRFLLITKDNFEELLRSYPKLF